MTCRRQPAPRQRPRPLHTSRIKVVARRAHHCSSSSRLALAWSSRIYGTGICSEQTVGCGNLKLTVR